MARRAISDEVRTAVQAALLAGIGISETARQYQLSKSTVSAIRAQLGPEVVQKVRTETRERLDDLLLDALRANLGAQKRIVEAASEPSYLREQPASDIASLYTAIADKAIRLLEAASLGDAGADSDIPHGPDA